LVRNRHIYTENFILEILKSTGFRNITTAHRFFYHVSVAKMSKVYWEDDSEKTQEFSKKTQELLETLEIDNILVDKSSPMDFELRIPAVFIVGQK